MATPMIKAASLLCLLLSGCSLVFSAAPADIDETSPDAGTELENSDAGANDPDADSPDELPAPDAEPAICDPFVEAACYVGNDPLDGPDFYTEGSGAACSSCEQSNDCEPGLFCTGFTDSPGTCAPLCDTSHPCAEGSCLGVQHQEFGFCPGAC